MVVHLRNVRVVDAYEEKEKERERLSLPMRHWWYEQYNHRLTRQALSNNILSVITETANGMWLYAKINSFHAHAQRAIQLVCICDGLEARQ